MRGESDPKRPSRAFVWLERTLLGLGMTFVAAVIDRVLFRMLKQGPVERAPRTAAGPGGDTDQPTISPAEPRSAVLAPPAKEVADQAGR